VLPKLGPVREFIDKILESDSRGLRKQRHTARRIWRRLLTEHADHPVAECWIKESVILTSDQINELLHRMYASEKSTVRRIERHLNTGWKTIKKS
jgi:hypothetical protein